MINKNIGKEEYIYEFISYKKIGSITLNKSDETIVKL